ncbi:MAG: leucine-rich repeat protein, partial [Clostridia bacterium]|nr:leucine-rich repeat protein [Clostridia bacterium]
MSVIDVMVFDYCSSLKSLVIPDNVKGIGAGAFADCTNLESIVLPDEILTFGINVF